MAQKKIKDLSPCFRIVKQPMVTEKSVTPLGPYERDRKGNLTAERRQTYVFEVDRNANKVEIKKAVEQIFDVEVEKVRTVITKGRSKRVRFRRVPTPPQKKAYVVLKEGHALDYMS